MKVRILTAVVGMSTIVPALLYGGLLTMQIIIGVVSLVGLYEYIKIVTGGQPVNYVDFGLTVVFWLVALFIPILGEIENLAPGIIFAFCLSLLLGVLVRTRTDPAEIKAMMVDRFFGAMWVGMLSTLLVLRECDNGLVWVFLALFACWATDSGGFFAGRAFGKHKLSPLISPKKTWEGFAGGMVACVAVVFAVDHFTAIEMTTIQTIGLGIALGVAAVIGDLAESLLKRAYGVKDSGTILPGHGGVLDRLDSLFFVAPVLYLFVGFCL